MQVYVGTLHSCVHVVVLQSKIQRYSVLNEQRNTTNPHNGEAETAQ